MKEFRQVIFWSMIVIIVFAILGGATYLQLVPFALFFPLAYGSIWNKKKYSVQIAILSLVMAIINLSIMSGIDIIVWSLCMLAWIKE